MLDDNAMAWLAAELACEVNRINCEQQMSIENVRQRFPDAKMRYGQGGLTQVFIIEGEEFEVGPMAGLPEVEAAYDAKKKVQLSPTQ